MTRRSHFSFRLLFHLSVLPLSGWAETSPSHSFGSFMLRNLVLTPLTCFANALLHFSGFASVLLFLANPKEKSAFFSHSLFKEAFKGLRYCSHIVVEGDVQSVLSIGFSGLLCCLWGAKGRKLGSFITHFFLFLWILRDVFWGLCCFDRMNGCELLDPRVAAGGME